MSDDDFKAGRALDALVAEKVMGHRPGVNSVHAYSTEIAAAWMVVEKIGNWHEFTFAVIKGVVQWEAGWYESGCEGLEQRASAVADTPPLAICLAALKTVEDTHA